MRRQKVRPPYHPGSPVRLDQNVEEALRAFQVDDQHDGGDDRENHRHEGRGDLRHSATLAGHPENGGEQHRAGCDPLREQVQRHVEAPRLRMRNVVVDTRGSRRFGILRHRAERAHDDLALLIHERPGGDFRLDGRLFSADVEDLRLRALLGPSHRDGLALHDLRDFACRVIEITENAAFRRTDAHACGLKLVLDAVRAKVALLGRVRIRIDEQLIVGTRRHAGAASDARIAVEVDDAVAPLEEGIGRTDADAGRVVALIAEHGKEEAFGVGERSLLDGLHPASVDADRNLVLGLAGDRAGVAADAFPQIDRETVIRHE
jgi:hypothetical protein